MPIQDSEAERRNLIVTSLCFIAYNLGGGNFTSNEVRLQVINVSFTDPIFLGFLAWMGLFWFAYRYWLKYSGEFSREFSKEFRSRFRKSYIANYLEKKTKEPLLGEFLEQGNSVLALVFEDINFYKISIINKC
tara:strand:+ start:66 stop:464 length:399 start_codon:yes stop_codon:yes gene_type:complete